MNRDVINAKQVSLLQKQWGPPMEIGGHLKG